MLEYSHITPHHNTKRICKCVCVHALMCIAYVDIVRVMPGIHLNDDLYVHNEVHTHV